MLAPVLALAIFHSQISPSGTGTALYKACQPELKPDGALTAPDYQMAAACIGYIDGYTDGFDLKDHGACLPDTTNLATLARIYLLFIDRHPKLLDAPKSFGLLQALQDAFPCPK